MPSFSQAKRRLELEVGEPQDLQDGDGPAKAKKQMACQSQSGGKGETLYCRVSCIECFSAG